MRKFIALAAVSIGSLVLVGCGSTSGKTVESEPASGGLDHEVIIEGTAEMTEIGNELGMISTLAAEACLQQNQTKIDSLSEQVTELLSRAESVPDGGSMNMVVARTSAQVALRKASEGLETCDPMTWMAVTTEMTATGTALAEVSREVGN